MCARNRKIPESRWEWVGRAAGWAVEKTRTGLAAVGIRGLILLAVAAGAYEGVGVATSRVGRMPQFRVYPERFRASAPEWCAKDLAAVRFPRESYSIFDPDLIREVAEAYLASPWVSAVHSIEKRFPNELRVEVVLREPAAFVRLPGGCYAVDAAGVELPLDYRHWDHLARPLPEIWGVGSGPPGPGRGWGDRRVRAAVAVLDVLRPEPRILSQIHVIDVANLDGEIDPLRSEIQLYTRSRVRVLWGRSPDTAKCGEPPVAAKLARLRRGFANPLAGSSSTINLRFPEDDAMAER